MNIFIRVTEMLIGNAFLTILAVRLFFFIRSKIIYLDVAIFGFLWIYLATLYSMLLGVFGLLEAHKIAIVSSIGILTYLIFCFRKSVIRLPDIFSFKYILIHSYFRPSFMLIFLAFFIFLQAVRCLFHIWYIPPYVWDTVVYHLVNVAEWVQKGKIFPVITPVERVYWPANFEVFETWFVVFLHNDLLIKFGPFLAYIVTGISAYALSRTIGLNNILSTSTAVFYTFTPSLAIQATACKNDVGISAVYLLSVAILMHILTKGAELRSRIWHQLLIVLMALCLGIGTKPYMVFISPTIIIIGSLSLWKQRKYFTRKRIILIKRTDLIIFAILITSSLFLGSYWYIRNLIMFDNPFHPTDFRIGKWLIFGTGNAVQFGPGQRGSASARVMIQNFHSLITERIFDKSGEFSSHLSNMSGWGWFNFSCGLSALVYALIFSKKIRLLIISFLISLIGLFTFITHDPWYMRFTLWFPVIFALSFTFLISNISLGWLKGLFWSLAFVCIMLNWIAVLNVGEISLDDFRKMMQIPPLQRSTAELTHHYDGAFKKALRIIPKDEIIGFCFPNNGWAYPLYDSDYSRNLMYVPIEDLNFVKFMKKNNINYLFIERVTPEQTKLIQMAIENKNLKKLEEFLYALEKD